MHVVSIEPHKLDAAKVKELRAQIRNAADLLKTMKEITEHYVIMHTRKELPFEDMMIDEDGTVSGLFYLSGRRTFRDATSLSYNVSFRVKSHYERGTVIHEGY